MKGTVRIALNGKDHSVADGTTVLQLVEQHAVDPASVAVAMNGEVIGRERYRTTCVAEHDDVRLIRAIAGG